MGVRALAVALAALVVLAAAAPYMLAAQPARAQQASAEQQAAEVLINITARAISVAKANGVNVTEAEKLYSEALTYYKEGLYNKTVSLCAEALESIASEARSMKPPYLPPAYGIKAQLLAIEYFVNSSKVLNATEKEYALGLVEKGLEDLSKGNVSGAAQVLGELKDYLANLSVKVSEYARHAMIGRLAKRLAHVKHELEGNWSYLQQANVSPGEVAEEVLETIEAELNQSARNATPAQLVGLARAVEEVEHEAPEIAPFPNASGRAMMFVAQMGVLRGLNQSLSQVEQFLSSLAGSDKEEAEEALNLTIKAINLTATALHYYAEGEDEEALALLNESASLANESAQIAENLTSSGHGAAVMVGRMIYRVDEFLIRLDHRLYEFIESTNIVGKTFEFEGVLLFEVNETYYVAVLRITNASHRMIHVVFALVVIGPSTKVSGSLAQIPARVEIVGKVVGQDHGLYVIEAESVTVESPPGPPS